jgi:hypothetical protein
MELLRLVVDDAVSYGQGLCQLSDVFLKDNEQEATHTLPKEES